MPQPAKPRKNRPRAKGCARCNFTGRAYSLTLKNLVRCVHCTAPDNSREVLLALKEAERRRIDQLLETAPLRRAQEELVLNLGLPESLLTTDRILQRWAVGHGSGLPHTSEELERLADAAAEQSDTFTEEVSKPSPLDDGTQTVIDLIVGPDPEMRVRTAHLDADPAAREHRRRLRANRYVSDRTARFVWEWYCKPIPCGVMASMRAIDESSLFEVWRMELGEMRAKFMGSGHRDLVALVRTVV
jgi:hypothetical protein